uniref:Putative sina superfamily protein n=1 Tax=Triticum aestivum TaxID=4565 RepID=A0A1I9RHI8_WHEAT|nr:putative sina superfamily protein [Triticum aestivum]
MTPAYQMLLDRSSWEASSPRMMPPYAKAGAERAAAAESCARKKARVESEARAAASKITVNLDHKLLECSACCSPLAPPLFQFYPAIFVYKGYTLQFSSVLRVHKWPHHMLRVPHQCGVQRCDIMERVLGGMTAPCSFREFGCSATIPFTKKLAHEDRQPFPREVCDSEPVRLVFLDARAVFLLVVERSGPSGRAVSVVQLVSEPVKEEEEKDFKYKIQVHTQAGVLSLSGETQSVGRLMRPYQAAASLFVSDDVWSPRDSPVYLELK